MKTEKTVSVLMSGLLCLCAAALGLMLALETTLFKQGYLAAKIEETGYAARVADTVRAACEGYATDAGLGAAVVDAYVTQEQVRTDIFMNTDAHYRGGAGSSRACFAGLTNQLEEIITKEQGGALSDEQRIQFSVLQITCEGAYRDAVRPPFEMALNVLLQYRAYRQWVWAAFLLLGAAAFYLLRKAVKDKTACQSCLLKAALGAALSLLIVAAVLRWALPYQSWMPEENIAYPLFCRWWGGLPAAAALYGGILLLALAAFQIWAVKHKKQGAETAVIKEGPEAAPARLPEETPAPAAQKKTWTYRPEK